MQGYKIILACGASFACIAISNTAAAQGVTEENAPSASQMTSGAGLQADGVAQSSVGDIVVTAQKRSESINKVPLSVTAISGDGLAARGVSTPADLEKVVPGFSASVSFYQTPVFFLRGVGYFESTLTADPAVSVYVDEIPLPFPSLTVGAGLDVERVEVLKGPQGILFGRNSTGGAINYIAAKPTEQFKAGFNAAYRRFGQTDLDGFVSGPLSETVTARFAFRTTQGGAWQKNYVRRDENGAANTTVARVILDWQPTDNLKMSLNVNGWLDRSENQAAQLFDIIPKNASLIINHPDLFFYPRAPFSNRAADWNPGRSLRNNTKFGQISIRADYDLADMIQLTSLTSYEYFDRYTPIDGDGTSLSDADALARGDLKTFVQEVRVAFDGDRLKLTAGANYESDVSNEHIRLELPDSANNPLAGQPLFAFETKDRQTADIYAAFLSGEYEVISDLKLQGGVRYTQANKSFNGCGIDDGSGMMATAFAALQGVLKRGTAPVILSLPGECYSLDENLNPARFIDKFNQNNISFKLGASWRSQGGLLLYGNVNQGYKAGGHPTTTVATNLQFKPVTQERVRAYELGFKAPIANGRVQLNGALFRNDYVNKQVRTNVPNVAFRTVSAIVNVPKSRIDGAEIELIARPLDGLNLSFAGTYLKTKVINFAGLDIFGVQRNFAGSKLPFASPWQASTTIDYKWELSRGLIIGVGGDATYHSRTNANFGETPITTIKPYLLLGAHVGVGSDDDRWKITIFGENITNTYYYNAVNLQPDALVRYTGRPATYGVKLALKY